MTDLLHHPINIYYRDYKERKLCMIKQYYLVSYIYFFVSPGINSLILGNSVSVLTPCSSICTFMKCLQLLYFIWSFC